MTKKQLPLLAKKNTIKVWKLKRKQIRPQQYHANIFAETKKYCRNRKTKREANREDDFIDTCIKASVAKKWNTKPCFLNWDGKQASIGHRKENENRSRALWIHLMYDTLDSEYNINICLNFLIKENPHPSQCKVENELTLCFQSFELVERKCLM